MQIRLLGPVDVWVDGRSRPVPGLRRKAVLAVLALQPGQVVSAKRLVEAVWGDDAPAAAPVTLQSHLSYLRRVLGDRAAILARRPGYVLDIGEDCTDVRAAEALIREATRSPDPVDAVARLQAAVALWRDRPLLDLAGLAWFEEVAHRLEQPLVAARQALIDARLALGQHTELIPELEGLIRRHSLHEHTHGQLMLALYRAGRQSDALAAYQNLRRILAEELDVGPSQPLGDLQAAILRQDSTLDPPPTPSVASDPSLATPEVAVVAAQLPPAVAVFTGRSGELAALDAMLAGARADDATPAPPAAVLISVVSGTAGIGKTALAVHWAHRVRGQFPDGQLYVNLRGFGPGGSVVDPVEVLRGFLDALGVPAEQSPASPQAQAALYRRQLVGKRVLVVLDNARDAQQVRPLLPDTPGCMAVVTSRDHLAPLAAVDGARPLTLDMLTTAEARDLLACRLGADRVAGEPDAVNDIITRCARLPLALVIVAARAAIHPDFPLSTLAAELRHADTRPAALHGGDPATDIRAEFSWS